MKYSDKLIESGFELHKKGDVEKALKFYLEALSSQNSNSKLLFLIGTANLQISNFKEAIKYLKKTISLDTSNFGAFNNLGAAFQNLKQYKDAIIIYEKLIKINLKTCCSY